MRQSNRTLFLIEVAIFTALALVLDLTPFLKFKIWAQGGSISFAMIPIFLVAFRWGLKGGLLSGFLWGMLQIAVGDAYIVHPLQGFIEYGLAFTVLGFAGVFSKQIIQAVKNNQPKAYFGYITVGVFLGSMLRLLGHFIAGVVFFAEYAPEDQPVWLYSLIYNSSFMIPSFILSTIIIFILFNKQPRTIIKQA